MRKEIAVAFVAGGFTVGAAFIGTADFWFNVIFPEPSPVLYDVVIKTRGNDRNSSAGTDGDVTFSTFAGQSSSSFVYSGAGSALDQGQRNIDIIELVLSGQIERLQMSILERGKKPGWLPQFVLFKNTKTGDLTCFYWDDLDANFVASSGKGRVTTDPVLPVKDLTKCEVIKS